MNFVMVKNDSDFLVWLSCGCRRDSFITHRAFCDALAQESGRAVNPHSLLSSHSQFRSHGLQFQAPSSLVMKREQEFNLLGQEIPSWLSSPTVLEESLHSQTLRTTLDFSTPQLFPTHANHSLFNHDQNPSPTSTTTTSYLPSLSSFHYSTTSPHMSATALLQKASQIGVTVSAAAPSQAMIVRPHLLLQQVHVPECTTATTTTTGYNNMAPSSAVSGMVMAIPSREEIGTHGFARGLAS